MKTETGRGNFISSRFRSLRDRSPALPLPTLPDGDGVLAGGPAGGVGEADQDDEQSQREGDDADDHVARVALPDLAGAEHFLGRRRIAANARHA